MRNKLAQTTLALVILTFLFTNSTFAQARLPLVVAPARQTVAIDPGKSENLQVKFFNESATSISGNIKAIDFIVTGKDGAPLLLEDQPNNWVKLPYDKASIAAGDVLRLNFKIQVPEGTSPGGRYIAIMFEPTGQLPEAGSGNESASSAVSPRVVSLISVRINGPVYESAFIDGFKMPKFLEFGPIPVNFEIINKGGYHITPTGQITVKNWFGKEVEKKTIETKNIFPNTKRVYEMEVGKTWMFGRYNVTLTSGYGESGKVVSTSQLIWVVPITLILVCLFATAILILSIFVIANKAKAKQLRLEEKLEEEINELESLKNKFKDRLPK